MTTIRAKVIADSVCQHSGNRLTTMQLRYPRFIHAEFMTHRQFSRNASSSRAIPVERMIQDIIEDTAMPLHWGKNQKGMQASEECDAQVKVHDDGFHVFTGTREEAWTVARDNAINIARRFHEAGYHKQVVNRLLEPFMHINVVVSSTEWSNFFALRDHADAEPHIAILARAMKKAMDQSEPAILSYGMWHVPYSGDHDEGVSYTDNPVYIQKSVARCARVSYRTHEGKEPTIAEDLELYGRLVQTKPLHASPAEHQATPDPYGESRGQWGNFVGWKQYRKTLPGECQ